MTNGRIDEEINIESSKDLENGIVELHGAFLIIVCELIDQTQRATTRIRLLYYLVYTHAISRERSFFARVVATKNLLRTSVRRAITIGGDDGQTRSLRGIY